MQTPLEHVLMTGSDGFPLPFASLSAQGGGEGSFIVGALFTPSFAGKAHRLAASCEKFRVPYVMHEVADVHRSISSKGTLDAAFTKANFIHHLLTQHQKPVLYVDADCEFVAEPELLPQLVESGCDFAIYNWLADEHTDAFAPVEIATRSGATVKNRFYAYSHSIDHFAQDQLLCSGLVQFYCHSEPARTLLREWQRTILRFPGCSDDACLDFAFNNLGLLGNSLKMRWLPKSYARISWWIYAEPVINNVAAPNDENVFVPVKDTAGRQRVYFERLNKRTEVRLFPRDCIVDTEQRTVCRIVNNELVLVSPTDQRFWL